MVRFIFDEHWLKFRFELKNNHDYEDMVTLWQMSYSFSQFSLEYLRLLA